MIKFFKNPKFFDLLIIFLLGLTPLLWFKPGNLALGHDMGFPLNPIGIFKERLFAWTDKADFGYDQTAALGGFTIHGFEAFIKGLGFSLQTTQKISFIFWLMMPGLAMYYFVCSLGLHKKMRFFPLAASIFYMFNHFLLQAWFIAERTKFSIIVALPLVLSFLIRGIGGELKLFKAAAVITLLLFFFNGGGGLGLALYGGLIIACGACFFYFTLLEWKKRSLKAVGRNFLFLSLIGFFFLLINSYWVFPFVVFVLKGAYQQLGSFGSPERVIEWVRYISENTSFLNFFRLQGIPSWYDNPFLFYADVFLKNPFLVLLSFSWFFLAFISIFLTQSKEERKYVVFFGLLVLISMAFSAGSHRPFGEIYVFFISRIPFLTIFRNPFYKFGYLIWFGYAFLTSFTVCKLIQRLRLKKLLFTISGFVFLAFILLYNYPFFTGSFFKWRPPLTTLVSPPGYIFEFDNWLNSIKGDKRILLLPPLNDGWRADAYRWNYWSLTILPNLLFKKPFLANSSNLKKNEAILVNALYKAIWDQDEEKVEKLSTALGVKYFLLRNDFYYDLDWCKTNSPADYQLKLESFPFVKPEEKFGEWSVYRLELDQELSKIYSAPKTRFLLGNESNLKEIFSDEVQDFQGNFIFLNYKDKELLNDKFLADEILIYGRCIRCNLAREQFHFELPPVRLLPFSKFYFLTTWKENYHEVKIKKTGGPNQLINLELGLATKRLAELQELSKILEKGKEEVALETVRKFRARINNVFTHLENFKNIDNDSLLLIGDYFKNYKRYLRSLTRSFSGGVNILIWDSFWKLDDYLKEVEERVWQSEKTIRRFVLEVPYDGNYELLIRNEKNWRNIFNESPFKNLPFVLDGKEYVFSGGEFSSNWISLGNFYLNKGKHRLAIYLPEFSNFSPERNFDFSTKEDGYSLSFPIDLLTPKGEPKGEYNISFEYLTEKGNGPRLTVVQDTDEEDKITPGLIQRRLDETLPVKEYWERYENSFDLNPDTQKVEIRLNFEKLTEENLVHFRNFEINWSWSPTVVIKTATDSAFLGEKKNPRVEFRKINPTLYEVEVKGAQGPFTLVFLEAFNPNWRAYIDDGRFSRGIFTAWFKKPLDPKRQFLINGYANAWYIAPEDINNQKNFKIIIEFWPQKWFYVGVPLTLFTFLSLFLYLILTKRQGK